MKPLFVELKTICVLNGTLITFSGGIRIWVDEGLRRIFQDSVEADDKLVSGLSAE